MTKQTLNVSPRKEKLKRNTVMAKDVKRALLGKKGQNSALGAN